MRPIVWDFDGTLADTWRDLATALNLALRDEGLLAAEPQGIKAWIGGGARSLVSQALAAQGGAPGRTDVVLESFRRHYAARCLDETRLYEGVPACLDALAPRPMAVVSNKPHRFLADMLAGLGLAGRFEPILGGDSLPECKPHPSVLQHVAAALGVAPSALWMIGDSETDVRAGLAVGAGVIACAWGLRDRATLRAAGATTIIASPAEIPAIVGV